MINVEGVPEFLYHYTSLEVAKKILMKKTIRFKSLASMDDLMEAQTADGGPLGKYVFASCWSEVEDSIPQWHLYGDQSRGVCVKLHSFPFKNNFEDYILAVDYVPPLSKNIEPGEIFITPVEVLMNETYMMHPIFIGDQNNSEQLRTNRFTAKVEYTDDIEKLVPKCIFPSNDKTISLQLGVLGKYKQSGWAFQKEWKYRLFYLPIGLKNYHLKQQDDLYLQQIFNSILRNDNPVVDFVDYRISDEAMDTLEIIAGPMMDETLYEEFVFFARGVNSKIQIKPSRYTRNWIVR